MIYYTCDKTKCNGCDSPVKDSGLCNRTSDVKHAANFEEINGDYWERDRDPIIIETAANDGPPVVLAIIGVISGFLMGLVGSVILF